MQKNSKLFFKEICLQAIVAQWCSGSAFKTGLQNLFIGNLRPNSINSTSNARQELNKGYLGAVMSVSENKQKRFLKNNL